MPVLCFPCHIRRDQHAVGGLFYSSWKNALTPNPPPGRVSPPHSHTHSTPLHSGRLVRRQLALVAVLVLLRLLGVLGLVHVGDRLPQLAQLLANLADAPRRVGGLDGGALVVAVSGLVGWVGEVVSCGVRRGRCARKAKQPPPSLSSSPEEDVRPARLLGGVGVLLGLGRFGLGGRFGFGGHGGGVGGWWRGCL